MTDRKDENEQQDESVENPDSSGDVTSEESSDSNLDEEQISESDTAESKSSEGDDASPSDADDGPSESSGQTERMEPATDRGPARETEMGLGTKEPEERRRAARQREHEYAVGHESSIEFSQIKQLAEQLFDQTKGFLPQVFVGLFVLSAVVGLLGTAYTYLFGAGGGDPGLLASLGSLALIGMSLFSSLITTTVVASLYPVVREVIVEEKNLDLNEAVSIGLDNIQSALFIAIVFHVLFTVGLGCCILPGFAVLILLTPSLYLVTARKMELMDALKHSANQVIDNPKPFAFLYVIFGGASIVLLGGINVVAYPLQGTMMSFPIALASSLFETGLSYFAFIGLSSLFILLEQSGK